MSAAAEGLDDGEISGINVTPLVDIMLVLLIIFMVTAKLSSETETRIQLPKTASAPAAATPALTVSVDAEGALKLMDAPVDLNGLAASLGREAKRDPGLRVTVAADGRLPYQKVVDVLDAVKKAGVSRVALAGESTGG